MTILYIYNSRHFPCLYQSGYSLGCGYGWYLDSRGCHGMGRPAQFGTTLVLAPPPLGHGMVPPSRNTVGRTSILGTGHLVLALSSRQPTPTTVNPSYSPPLLGGGTCPGTWWCGGLGHGLACGSRLPCDFGSSCTTTTGITTQCHCLESNNQFVLVVVVVVIVISSPTATTTTTPSLRLSGEAAVGIPPSGLPILPPHGGTGFTWRERPKPASWPTTFPRLALSMPAIHKTMWLCGIIPTVVA